MSRSLVLIAVATLTLGACTWVKMEPEGARVRVLPMGGSTQGCTARGEIGVSVRDRVGLLQRSDLKVRDELETMARNEATSLDADTVQPLEEPSAGEQRFMAYRCGRAALPASRTPTRPAAPALQMEEAETFPIED